MRTFFTAVVTVIVTFVCATTVIIARLFRMQEGPDSIYERAMRGWAVAVVRAAGVRLHVHGAEHIQRETGAVYISNHVSWFDVFSLAAYLPRSTFIAKRELRRIPIFGKGAEFAGIIFLDRDNRKAAFESYRVAAGHVRKGRSLVVCPEGTRGVDYHLRPFKKGPFVLAITAGAPIVPTVVYGAREIMPKGSFRVHAGDVHIHFLEPVSTVGQEYSGRSELMEEVWRRMAAELEAQYGIQSPATAIDA
jgi:1-acyl-sn-glycerol-3-phosphate acyltransferase